MDLTAAQTIRLWDALVSVSDHRRAAGKRYPLASLLLIALAAMLVGRRDKLGIIRWGRRLNRETLAAICISRDRVPAPSVWDELFQALDVAELERAFGGWVAGKATVEGHVAIDGKRLRGSATAQSPGTHLLAAFSASLQGVIGQLRVAPEANEITAALELLKTLPLKGVRGERRVSREFISKQTELKAWLAKQPTEAALEPDLPIINPHDHF
jgi:hypothetical protein